MSTPPVRRNTKARSSSSQLAVAVGSVAPVPQRTSGPRTGATRASMRPSHPSPVQVHPWSRSSPPPTSPPHSNITLDAARQVIADGLELTYRLPRLFDLTRSGVVPVWVARAISRETHDLSIGSRGVRRPAHRRHPGQDPPGRRHQARRGSAVVLRPRPRHRRRGTRARPTRRLGQAPQQPRHHRRGDDPRHPRRPPLRPDHQPPRRTTCTNSATPTPSTTAEHEQSGSSPTPNTRLTSSAGTKAPHPSRGSGAMNLFVHLTPEDLTGDGTGAVSIEKLGAATTQLLADWLTGHAATGGKVILRPVIDLSSTAAVDQHDPPTALTRAVPPARPTLRLPRLPTRLPLLRPRPHRSLHPDGRRRPTGPDERPRTWRRCAGPITGSRPIRPGTTSASTDGTYTWTAPTGHQYDVTPASRRPPPRRT